MISYNGSDFVASICLDITDMIQLQQELSELTQNIPGGVCKILMDEDFTLLYGNDSFYELYGYTAMEMQTQLGNKLIATIHPEDATSIMEMEHPDTLTAIRKPALNLSSGFSTKMDPSAIF